MKKARTVWENMKKEAEQQGRGRSRRSRRRKVIPEYVDVGFWKASTSSPGSLDKWKMGGKWVESDRNCEVRPCKAPLASKAVGATP